VIRERIAGVISAAVSCAHAYNRAGVRRTCDAAHPGGEAMKTSPIVCVTLTVLLVAGSAVAHHSPVIFDRSKKVALTGTVTEFAWTNPHASIQLDVQNESGGVDKWGVEMNSPNNLAREGWKSTLVKAGDKVTVVVFPLKSGERGGMFSAIKLADGRTLGELTEDLQSQDRKRR
jgi:hypothetical protein